MNWGYTEWMCSVHPQVFGKEPTNVRLQMLLQIFFLHNLCAIVDPFISSSRNSPEMMIFSCIFIKSLKLQCTPLCSTHHMWWQNYTTICELFNSFFRSWRKKAAIEKHNKKVPRKVCPIKKSFLWNLHNPFISQKVISKYVVGKIKI